MTKNQEAIRRLFNITRDNAGNMPSLPAIFPDGVAPVILHEDNWETWMKAPADEAMKLQRPWPVDGLKIVKRGADKDD